MSCCDDEPGAHDGHSNSRCKRHFIHPIIKYWLFKIDYRAQYNFEVSHHQEPHFEVEYAWRTSLAAVVIQASHVDRQCNREECEAHEEHYHDSDESSVRNESIVLVTRLEQNWELVAFVLLVPNALERIEVVESHDGEKLCSYGTYLARQLDVEKRQMQQNL